MCTCLVSASKCVDSACRTDVAILSVFIVLFGSSKCQVVCAHGFTCQMNHAPEMPFCVGSLRLYIAHSSHRSELLLCLP